MPVVKIIIPAYNEADIIEDTVKSALCIPDVEKVVVIDDGSADNTAETAEKAGARVIRLKVNSGKGEAMNTAVNEIDADIYLFIDADLGETAYETHRLLEPVLSDYADMSIAIMKAPDGHKGGFGFVMKLAKWGIKKYSGSNIIAPISGQRAIRKKVIDDITPFERDYGVETAMTIDALRAGHRIVEVPLPLTHRLSGRNLRGFIHRGKQFIHILKAIVKRR